MASFARTFFANFFWVTVPLINVLPLIIFAAVAAPAPVRAIPVRKAARISQVCRRLREECVELLTGEVIGRTRSVALRAGGDEVFERNCRPPWARGRW